MGKRFQLAGRQKRRDLTRPSGAHQEATVDLDPTPISHILSGIDTIRYGGWSGSRDTFQRALNRLHKTLSALRFKVTQSVDFPLVITLQGGTGTGKSSVFNGLIGKPISRTGIERPQTRGCVVLIPKGVWAELDTLPPFSQMEFSLFNASDLSTWVDGAPGAMTLVESDMAGWSRMILIDSPDLDSVEPDNRALAEDIITFSDLIIFVTSQEKYADQTPFDFIRTANYDRKPFLLIINKLDNPEGLEDLQKKLDEFKVRPYVESIGFPRMPHDAPVILDSSHIAPLKEALDDLDKNKVVQLSRGALFRASFRSFEELNEAVLRESSMRDRLIESVDRIYNSACDRLERRISSGVDQQSEKEIRKHIRSLLVKYDFLRKPRSIIRSVIKYPFRMLGLGRDEKEKSMAAPPSFIPPNPHMDPLLEAHAWFQQELARSMGADDASGVLYSRMSQEGLFIHVDELRDLYTQEQKEIDRWVKGKFAELKKGLSRAKEFGLYSATFLAGLLIVAVESVTFGGFTFFEILLDTAIAPFVPRGVLELFIYDQLKEIGRELDERHRAALRAILDEQRRRLIKFLDEHMSGPRERAFFQETLRWFKDHKDQF